MLELRVLTGLHAGARVLLPNTPQSLGSAPDCDLLLGDEGLRGHHAQLHARDDGTVELTWLDAPGLPLQLRPGEGVVLGPVRIAIALVDAPWQDEVLLVGPERPAGASSSPAPGLPRPAGPLVTGTDRRPGRTGRLVLLGGVAVMAGIAVWLVAPHTEFQLAWSGPTLAPPASAPSPTAGPEGAAAAMRETQAAVDALGLGPRVRIDTDPARGLQVRAAFLSREETQALRATLAGLTTPLRPSVVSAEQVQGQLEEALLSLDLGHGSGLRALALGPGRFRIEGHIRHAAQREQVLAAAAAASPWVLELEPALTTEEERARSLLQSLRDLRLGDVDGTWADGRLEVQVRMPPETLPRWERELAQAVARHPVPLRVQVIPATAAASVPRLPFALRSVIGGSMPVVTLADGRRLAPDGQAEGWRLVAVRSDGVVFERRDGVRITLER